MTPNVRESGVCKLLVANRGEIATRVIKACFDEGVSSVATVSEADVDSLPARLADESIVIGPSSAAGSYLSVEAVVSAALITGCDALHPGYGFLSERPELAEECAQNGIAFVGPSADAIRAGGDKVAARQLAHKLGIPIGAGSEAVTDAHTAKNIAEEVGYPVLLKAAAGGGGRGMMLVADPVDFQEMFHRGCWEAAQAFGDGRLYVERYVANARHVEVQVLADHHGNLIHLGDRDCSVQRRYQKLIEEAPASTIPGTVRRQLADAALTLLKELGYCGAGTVEFLYDADRNTFSFLEINTRVQVEHPVTEMVTGIDIVREQLRIAAGNRLSLTQSDVQLQGYAVECRLNAESARNGFQPSPGQIGRWVVPEGSNVRVDTHCFSGYQVPPHYDSLLAKLICRGEDRSHAIRTLERALEHTEITGIESTADFYRALVRHPGFRANKLNTRWVESELLPWWESWREETETATY